MLSRFIAYTILTCLCVSCRKSEEKTRPLTGTITESVYASGVIKGKNQYQVYSTVNGLVEKILVSEGDLVKKGTPVIQLVRRIAIMNAENAGLLAAYSSVSSNKERLHELENNISLARLKMENDASLLERQKNLWTQKIGTRFDYEQRELGYSNSLNAYESAKLRYAETLKQLRFQEQQSRKNLQIVQTSANDYIIKSERDGQVYDILKKAGEMVTPQTAVAIIGDADRFLIELQIDEFDIAKVKTGQKMVVNMDSYRGKIFEAKVTRIIPYMNERSKSFTIEAMFVKAPPTLYPNLTCEANIVISQKDKALTIPRDYLLDGGYVLLERDKKQKVSTGLMDYKRVEILSGLLGNENLIKPQ
ncbi:efflux RND transporter periplasmic adaptor subunit [Dyadobacter psychrotolerans]|uniref:HlyD family efflux transporter periplasmic adaptor subunit n=1 Tax=Dyadobacter psychrotolerans TaxID=2541721 RepID=A0A4R5DU28_9BACT|nr:efflux RND transporter periplasmic adaptor subunit [Dyadobacter psychrotolerans]TDE17992.1 HlyD family efflux transporter periplasmic adaptor subunit [Dyadobacter psychrotolerans]